MAILLPLIWACNKTADNSRPETKDLNFLELCDNIIAAENKVNPRTRVYIVAHRGNTYYGVLHSIPGNSLPAYEQAIAAGADMIETDVRTTSDGVLVMCHNDAIDETTTGKGLINSYTYEQLMQFDLKEGNHIYKDANGNTIKIPTLEQTLNLCKGRIFLNLDCKNVTASLLIRTIQKCGMQNQVMIYGTDLEDCQKRDPTIAIHPFIWNVGDLQQYSTFPGAKLFQYPYTKFNMDNPQLAKDVRAAGFLTYSNVLSFDAGFLSGNYAPLDKFIESETDFCQTDYCEKVDAYLKTKGLR